MTTIQRNRVVLDTNQIISAGSRWVMLDPLTPDERNEAQMLIHSVATNHTGLISSHIAAEYVRKLMDRGHPHERTTRYLGFLLATFEKVDVISKVCSPAPSDPDDIVFILCAIDGNADLLVSEDRHLLSLRPHYKRPEIIPRSEATPRLLRRDKPSSNPKRERLLRSIWAKIVFAVRKLKGP